LSTDAQRPPEGTIALLFTDIEGSTRLATELGAAWPDVLATHHQLLSDAIAAERGFVDGTEGDAFFAAFADAAAAARAAVAALRAFREFDWPADAGELKVRMGMHVGFVERTEAGYVGLEIHRAARVAAAAHGGQLLMTSVARGLVGDAVPTESVGVHRLKDFPSPEQLFCAVVDGRGAAAFPPPRAAEARPTNLPAGLPTLVGRDDDLRRVRDAFLVDGERLVTVTGRGGAGKTSLALVAASSLLDHYPGGVWLARLANVTDPDDVLGAVASSTGAAREVERSPFAAITASLRERGPVLLVLDNMERLLPAAPGIADLIDALPDLRVLVTSQAPLRLEAESCVPLDALEEQAALALMERVARRRTAGFAVSSSAQAELLEVVRLVDGLPLALELAAARLPLLTPAQLSERLRASPDVLRDDRSDRPERHRTLRATVDWTLRLLDAAARALFTRLGAFAGPVELEEIEAVAGRDGLDVLEALATLLDVALVRRVESGDGRVRFGLPEALRQIASALLDETPGGAFWRRAHALRQRDIVWAARTVSNTTQVQGAAIRADAEIAAAIRWARAASDPIAAEMASARAALLADKGHLREAFAMLDPLLRSPPEDPVVYGQVLWAHSWVLANIGQLEGALVAAEKAVAGAADEENRAIALGVRGFIHGLLGNHDQAVRDCAESTAICRAFGPAKLTVAMVVEAQARLFAGDHAAAARMLAEAERIGEAADSNFLWHRHTLYGDLAMLSGRPRDALDDYIISLEEAQSRGHEMQILYDLLGVANALAMLGQDADAVEVAGIAEQQIAELGGPEATGMHLLGTAAEDEAERRVGHTAAAELKAHGRAVPAPGRVARACELARAAAHSAVDAAGSV
jgi:predicted ATPase/class 3 adenylate cyclase